MVVWKNPEARTRVGGATLVLCGEEMVSEPDEKGKMARVSCKPPRGLDLVLRAVPEGNIGLAAKARRSKRSEKEWAEYTSYYQTKTAVPPQGSH